MYSELIESICEHVKALSNIINEFESKGKSERILSIDIEHSIKQADYDYYLHTDNEVHMSEELFFKCFPEYELKHFSEKYPCCYFHKIDNVKFFCITEEKKDRKND